MDKILTRNFDGDSPMNLVAYQQSGGYETLNFILGKPRNELLAILKESELRGCGGAGFMTGIKWSFKSPDAPRPVYLVVNLDESEPGSFKDRQILYRDPHTLIEGIIASAYVIDADKVFVFVRGEYRVGAEILSVAIEEALQVNLLGNNILNSGFNLDIDVHLSAGRYICGEETALLNALEGYRANPRSKPPFPIAKGLWGQPTIVNNVETICHVPFILYRGSSWFKNQGVNGGYGSHIYQISGPVNNPGFFELPLGTTAREIIFEHAKGMLAGHELVGFLPGGASTQFMLPEHLDIPLHWEGPAKAGSRLGTGGLIIMDQLTCPIDFMINLMNFFTRESCGYCTPCRDGLPYVKYLLETIEQGTAKMKDLDTLKELCHAIYPNTFCAFAPGALMPIMSGMEKFSEILISHIENQGCSFGES